MTRSVDALVLVNGNGKRVNYNAFTNKELDSIRLALIGLNKISSKAIEHNFVIRTRTR